ncbi:MAG: hypothetical protein LUI85_03765 [Bacteroides sp.]|nr:hypothetical protein [Bacteroides sp.]
MKEKGKKIVEGKNDTAKEEQVSYQPKRSCNGVTRFITQTELDEECFTLQESKAMILEKVHRHFQQS